MPRIYTDLASAWYRLFTPIEEYEDEALLYRNILLTREVAGGSLLELGSGAGHNAFFLKKWYTATLTDVSPEMLSLSREINPECPHVQEDMRHLRLDETFDIVFIHDAIMYMTSEEDLALAVETAFFHCKRGGVVLISPDYVSETFEPSTDHGGSDKDGRGVRWLEWTQFSREGQQTYTVDYALLMQETDGSISMEHDHHIEGLFSQQTWMSIFKKHSNAVEAIPDHYGRINFLVRKR